jgi:hypothetical protein
VAIEGVVHAPGEFVSMLARHALAEMLGAHRPDSLIP